MAYLASAGRRNTWPEPGNALDQQPNDHDSGGRVDVDVEAGLSLYQAWSQDARMLSERDEELIRAWADQADGLVTFAALFSGVVTAFIIETYKLLQPDTDLLTLSVLRDISAQLNGSQPLHPTPPFKPLLSDAVQNSLLFASLISSLFSAGTGVFFKEWVREYKLNLPTDPHELVRVRQHRYQGAIIWRLRAILGAISLFLQLGVAFFVGGLLLFVWNLDQTLRAVLVVFAAFWMAFWIGSACCPTFSDSCPFISPLSRLIFVVLTAVRRIWLTAGRSPGPAEGALQTTMETRERECVGRRGTALDCASLKYIYNTYWEDRRLVGLDVCIEALPALEAISLIEDILKAHFPSEGAVTDFLRGRLQADHPVLRRLAEIWQKRQHEREDVPAYRGREYRAKSAMRRGSAATASTLDVYNATPATSVAGAVGHPPSRSARDYHSSRVGNRSKDEVSVQAFESVTND